MLWVVTVGNLSLSATWCRRVCITLLIMVLQPSLMVHESLMVLTGGERWGCRVSSLIMVSAYVESYERGMVERGDWLY